MQLESPGTWRAERGAYVWTLTTESRQQKKDDRKCPQCGTLFKPRRTNHTYCEPVCKKAAEYERKRARELVNRRIRHTIAEQEARKVGDFADARYLHAQIERDAPILADAIMNSDNTFAKEVEKLLEAWSKVKPEDCYRDFKNWQDRTSEERRKDARLIDHLTQSRYNPDTGTYEPRHNWPTFGRARRKPATPFDDLHIKNKGP